MSSERQQPKRRLVSAMTIVPVALSIGFVAVIWLLFATTPSPQMQAPPVKKPVVEAMAINVVDRAVTTTSQGVVRPANGAAELRPQVSGDVIATHDGFTPGGIIPAGEPILQIDRTDYDLALADARAALNQARANVEMEKGQQRIAEAEFELLESDIEFDESSRALALRQPQLQRVEAELEAARAAYDRAELNLQRTALSLPYDAVVLSVEAVEGEYMGARDLAGTLARADAFWVELRVRHDVLGRLTSRSRTGDGADVTVSMNGIDYPGEVIRIRADVSEETRMGGAFVEVTDPLSLSARHENRPPLLIGSYVEAQLDAGRIEDIIAMPRRALRDNNEVYVADAADQLASRDVTIAWELEDTVLIQPTFEDGDRIITSRVSGIPPGTELSVRMDESAPAAAGEPAGAGTGLQGAGMLSGGTASGGASSGSH